MVKKLHTYLETGGYKDRKDIGIQRGSRDKQPEKERGSEEVKQTYAEKEKERRLKATKERLAKKGIEEKADTTASLEPIKLHPRINRDKETNKLLRRNEPDIDLRPKDQPKRPVMGISRKQRKRILRAGERLLNRLRKRNAWERSQEAGEKDL
jgi:hypothetical protein